MATLISSREAPRPGRTPPFALWALGFRPFYLLASGFAALSVALWALQFAGWLGQAYLQGPLWHAHEMLFGFSMAVLLALAAVLRVALPLLAPSWLVGAVLLWSAGFAVLAFALRAQAQELVPAVAAFRV